MVTRYFGADIYLGNGQWESEIYVSEGIVVSACKADTEINLSGNTLIPSFRDGHAHPLFAGREILGLDVTKARSLEEIGSLLKQYRFNNASTTWIAGGSYNRALPGIFSREFLDSYVSDVPVTIHADDHHTLWANSKALEVAGILGSDLPKLQQGSIDLDSAGLPNGILRETEAIQLVLKHQPRPTVQEDSKAFKEAEQRLISAGITSVFDAWVEPGIMDSYLALSHELQLDYQLAILISPDNAEESLSVAKQAIAKFKDNPKVQVQAVKIFIDGVFGSATAAVEQPYLSTGQHGDLNWNKDSLVETITRAHQLGLQAHIHAIGDKAIEFAIEAIDLAEGGSLPPVIAHAELTNSSLLAKVKDKNISLCVQPYWAQLNDMLLSCVQHLGESRTHALYAFKDMLQLGINVVFSSDWPVSSYKPFEGIAVAVNRRLQNEMPKHNEGQAINLEQALDAYTVNNLKMLGKKASVLNAGDPFDAVLIEGKLKQKNLGELASSKILAVYKSGVNLLP